MDRTPSSGQLRWVRAPQQARSQQTLDRILDAAEALVAEKGFADTAVAEVARRAGSSVGAFYARFRDKDGLLYALYERYFQQAVATADDALDPERWDGANIPEILAEVVRFLVAVYRDTGGLLHAFVVRNHVDPEFHARQEQLSHYVTRKLTDLLMARRDEIGSPDPERAVSFGIAVVFSTIEATVLFGDTRSGNFQFSDDEIASELTRVYLAYLGVRSSA